MAKESDSPLLGQGEEIRWAMIVGCQWQYCLGAHWLHADLGANVSDIVRCQLEWDTEVPMNA